MRAAVSKRLRRRAALFFWLVFGGGVLVHYLAPNLERKQDGFVIPEALTAGRSGLDPGWIVAKERRMQWISAVLTATGALGLGYLHRRELWPSVAAGGRNRFGKGGSDCSESGGGGIGARSGTPKPT